MPRRATGDNFAMVAYFLVCLWLWVMASLDCWISFLLNLNPAAAMLPPLPRGDPLGRRPTTTTVRRTQMGARRTDSTAPLFSLC